MELINSKNKRHHDYITYGRQFAAYRWYKPLIVVAVFAAAYVLAYLAVVTAAGLTGMLGGVSADDVISRFGGGYDNMDVSDPVGSLINLGGVAAMIPALAVASLIVRDRPFSSYSSSRGGWSHGVFFRCLPIAIITCAVPIVVNSVIFEHSGSFRNSFTAAGLAVFLVLVPLQCIAEEYVFRGLVTQTLGSWFRFPLVALLIQALGFAALHPYNLYGRIAVFASGLGMGLAAWLGRGIEVSSALHIVNNITVFTLSSLNLSKVSSEVSLREMALSAGINVLYVLVVLILSKRTDWFSRIKKNDLERANDKYIAKKRRRAAKKGFSYEPPAGIIFTGSEESSAASGAGPDNDGFSAASKANTVIFPASALGDIDPDAADALDATDAPDFSYGSERHAKKYEGKHFKKK